MKRTLILLVAALPVGFAALAAQGQTVTACLAHHFSVHSRPIPGPTFSFGGVVSDPKSLFGQSFVELQFYPDSMVKNCFPNGAFSVNFAANTYTACLPVFRLTTVGQGKAKETTAFNAMLTDGTGKNNPLIMHAGDSVSPARPS